MTWRLMALISAAALCVSCTNAVTGNPAVDSAAPKIPPRPRELHINNFAPCDTLTDDQLKALHVRYLGKDAPSGKRGPGCQWNHSPYEPVETYTVAVDTDGGVELAFGQPQLQVIAVVGFGAIETPALFSSGQKDCIVHVDVASRQALQVGYFYDGATVPMTHEIACAKARHAAELAMRTVLAKLGG